jgi:hypothetical protein
MIDILIGKKWNMNAKKSCSTLQKVEKMWETKHELALIREVLNSFTASVHVHTDNQNESTNNTTIFQREWSLAVSEYEQLKQIENELVFERLKIGSSGKKWNYGFV